MNVKQAVLFEGPSKTTEKIYIVTEGYPLEVLVSLKDWKKVKDHNGKISWIESKNIHNERTVLPVPNYQQALENLVLRPRIFPH